MGLNKWQTADSWPPKGAQPLTLYLSDGGTLDHKAPATDKPQTFTYDPMNPAPTYGGNVCCQPSGTGPDRTISARWRHGPTSWSTRPTRSRPPPELSGPITVDLYVSSDRKDTDFTVKLIDVYPDGRAYNLDETIQRVRYRSGYDKTVWMEPGKVYKVTLGPMNTSNYLDTGHKLRIEVSSSNFPRFDRQPEHRRSQLRRDDRPAGAQRGAPREQYPSSITVTVVSTPRSPHRANAARTYSARRPAWLTCSSSAPPGGAWNVKRLAPIANTESDRGNPAGLRDCRRAAGG